MKTITVEEVKEVIERHGKWMSGEDGGEKARHASERAAVATINSNAFPQSSFL